MLQLKTLIELTHNIGSKSKNNSVRTSILRQKYEKEWIVPFDVQFIAIKSFEVLTCESPDYHNLLNNISCFVGEFLSEFNTFL